MKTALVTGVTGQDGSYLAELLLEQGYRVIGMVRRTSTLNFDRLRDVQDRIEIVQGDLLDQMSIINILQEYRPSEVYNLAAQSFVPTSFTQPLLTGEYTALGVTRMLEAVRIVDPKIRFYQASSSEMFGTHWQRRAGRSGRGRGQRGDGRRRRRRNSPVRCGVDSGLLPAPLVGGHEAARRRRTRLTRRAVRDAAATRRRAPAPARGARRAATPATR